jgi:hypothetical protein
MSIRLYDHLTRLSPELLVNIISHFSISDFLTLSQIHPVIREVFKKNAAQICNMTIQNDPEFRLHVKQVEPTYVGGWLLPSSFHILLNPQLAQRILTKKVIKRLGIPKAPASGHPSEIDIAWNTLGLKVKLNEKGPQFLCFLEWERDERHANGAMNPVSWVPNHHFHYHCANWVLRFLTSHEENALAISGFADTSRKKWFPKELLWFYGVDTIEKAMKEIEEAESL